MARDLEGEYTRKKAQAGAIDRMAQTIKKWGEDRPARRAAWASQPGFSPTDTAQERADLRKMMGDHKSAYWRGPDAEVNQARYRELLESGDS